MSGVRGQIFIGRSVEALRDCVAEHTSETWHPRGTRALLRKNPKKTQTRMCSVTICCQEKKFFGKQLGEDDILAYARNCKLLKRLGAAMLQRINDRTAEVRIV